MASFIDWSTVDDDKGRLGKRKLKEKKDKQRVWCVISQDRFIFPLGWIAAHKCKWHRCLRRDRWFPTSQLCASPIPPEGVAPLSNLHWCNGHGESWRREKQGGQAKLSISIPTWRPCSQDGQTKAVPATALHTNSIPQTNQAIQTPMQVL